TRCCVGATRAIGSICSRPRRRTLSSTVRTLPSSACAWMAMRRREVMLDGVDTYLRRYPDSPILLDVLGTLDADAIRARAWGIEPEAEEIFFLGASVGALFGVRRRGGARVAIKINKLFGDETYFAEVQELQGLLASGGYPAPRPLRRLGTVTVDEWLDAGVFRNAHEPPVRRAMVRELVRFHRLATATGVRPRPAVLPPAPARWPPPPTPPF